MSTEPKIENEPVLLPYKFAKTQKVLKGDKKLYCIGIDWPEKEKYSRGSCRSMGNKVAKFYRENSRGLLNMSVKAGMVKVPYEGSRRNVRKAERIAMSKYKGGDIYAIPSKYSNNHAGGNTAHLRGTLARTAAHEICHLFGLGHAGAYKNNGEGRGLDYYGDSQSVMGSSPSSLLSPPQYYSLGWFRENEVAVFDPDRVDENGNKVPVQLFKLRRIADRNHDNVATNSVATVIYRADGRDGFVSWPNCKKGFSCVSLHLSNGGASQRVKIFGSEFYDKRFTKLLMKKVSEDKEEGTITISIEKPDPLEMESSERGFEVEEKECLDCPEYDEKDDDFSEDEDDSLSEDETEVGIDEANEILKGYVSEEE